MWTKTANSMKEVLDKDLSNNEKIKQMLIIVSTDIESRNGYGYRLFKSFKNSPCFASTEILDVRKLLNESFSSVIDGTKNRKQAKVNIIISLLLNGIISESDILLNEYISIIE
jgi:hypothetical protein